MTNLSSYTPLESLLLFQALQADGVTSIPFSKISNQLQSIPLIRNDASFDSARLEPAALKELYLGLLEEEALQDIQDVQDAKWSHVESQPAQDGLASPNSRKRRAPTPSLPTVEEAAKHAHLIPKLIYRLYARYREKVVNEIRAEERRYDAITREIKEIEDGQWDEKLRKEQAEQAGKGEKTEKAEKTEKTVKADTTDKADKAPVEARPASQNTHPSHRPILPAPDQDRLRAPATASPVPQSGGAAQSKEAQSERPNHAKIDAVINHEPELVRKSASPRPTKPPSSTALPPLSEMAPDPGPYRPPQHTHTPQLPPPLQSAPPYRGSPPIGHQPPYPPPPQYPLPTSQGPSPSPKLQNVMARASSSSPRPVLPLPPGMKMQSQSPVMQNGVLNHRPPPLQPHTSHHYPSPTQRPPPQLQPAERSTPTAMPRLQTPSAYPQPYPYQGRPQSYPVPPPPSQQQPQQQPQQAQAQYGPRHSHQLPPHQGGVQLPPFQVGPQEPNCPQQPHLAPNQHSSVQQLRPAPTPPTQHSFQPYAPYTQHNHQALPLHVQTHSATSIVEALRKAPWPTWKAARPAHLPQPQSDSSPAFEALSPPTQPATLPSRQLETSKEQEEEEPSQESMLAPSDQKPAPASSRSTKSGRKSTRRSRAGSAASSVVASSVRARTRSQSVVSHAESQPAPSEASASTRHVKDEPTTPADFAHQEILAVPTETPLTNRGVRPRRSTFQTQASAQSNSKRKRQRSPSPAADESEAVPTYLAPRNDVVAASRNFQRLSAVIMNDITTHKHAGPFQKPVREKDAEGYKDIIKRPQDLKSIKAAITFGNRAIGAATLKDASTDSPSATPSGNTSREGGTVILEKTTDLIPPRAIVNSSQLEKEVMRMFANAVMFNPGEGGMVQDAREMADDIEAKVRDWRSAERQVEGRDEDDDSTATGAGPGKRRKL